MGPLGDISWTSDPSKLRAEDILHAQQTIDGECDSLEESMYVLETATEKTKQYAVVSFAQLLLTDQNISDIAGNLTTLEDVLHERNLNLLNPSAVPGWSEELRQSLVADTEPATQEPLPLHISELPDDALVEKLFNVTLKGVKDDALKTENATLEGLHDDHREFRAQEAQRLMQQVQQGKPPKGVQTEEEQEGLARILKHRINYASFYPNGTVPADSVKRIQATIDALALSNSPQIVTLKDGTTCFAIPGGTQNHATAYEFRKTGDRYFFTIHNRGQGCSDPRLHGSVAGIDPTSGKQYRKTVVTIEVSKEALKDPKFLSALTNGFTSSDPTFAYDAIYYHLLKANRGTLIQSEAESWLEKLHAQVLNPLLSDSDKEDIQTLMLDLMALDPSFTSVQLYGTCVESSATSAEKALAPASTRWALKLNTTAALVDSAQERTFSNQKKTIPQIIALSQAQLRRLGTKFESPKKTLKSFAKVSSEAEQLLVKVKPKVSAETVKKQANGVIAQFMQTFDLAEDEIAEESFTLLSAAQAHNDYAVALMMNFKTQCEELLKNLDKTSDEYKKIEKIQNVITQFVDERNSEPFTEARQIERQFNEAFIQMQLGAPQDRRAQITAISKGAAALADPIDKIKRLPKGDPRCTNRFWLKLMFKAAEVQRLIDTLPKWKTDSLKQQAETLQSQVNAINLIARTQMLTKLR